MGRHHATQSEAAEINIYPLNTKVVSLLKYAFYAFRSMSVGEILKKYEKIRIAACFAAPVQVKSCHLCVVSVIASVGLALHHVVPAVPEGEGRRRVF